MPATWQAGDTAPPIRFTISEDGGPLDLGGMTVLFRFGPKGQAATFERECTVDDADAGTCHLDWQDDDLAESGDYEGQLVLRYADATQRLSAPFEISVARSIPVPVEP
ncbi:MAG: BppU family phage baseplate upper protein [Armatimonadota bacterium]